MNWMKSKLKIIAIAFSAIVIATGGYAIDQTFNVTMRIMIALATTTTADLVFPDTGSIISEAQTVVVAPGTTGAAAFAISGEPDETIAVSVVESTVSMSNGTDTFNVDAFTIDGANCAAGAGTLNASGALNTCQVGATANVLADQAPGNYSAVATLQVVYN